MTKNEFVSICAMLYVHPSVALEHPEVLAALRAGADADEVEQLLTALF
jgi:hypothetical protein